MHHTTCLQKIKTRLPQLMSFLCASFTLVVLPLLFNDAFFDINRVKVNAVYAVVPALAAAMLIALLFDARPAKRGLLGKDTRFVFISIGLFIAACSTSCALQGFSSAVLLGNTGRYCGLYFVLCCALAFFMIAGGALCGHVVSRVAVICASAVAALGVINALGVDPLGFYDRIKAGQETTFLSTIGHFDFFGTYLVLLLPLAGGMFIFCEKRNARVLGGVCAALIAVGTYASRTDSALIGAHLSCAALLAMSGDSFLQMARACFLWGGCFAALPLSRWILSHSSFSLHFSAPLTLLYEKHIALALVVLFFIAGAALLWAENNRRRAPGKRRFAAAVLIALFILALLLVGLIVYFTVFAPGFPLGKAEHFLRFSDTWGSYRGFVYTRALRAFEDFTLTEKLFGKGMDTALGILTPYFDDPAMLVSGVFNDAHNQLLQLLITCGFFGAGSFALFYLAMLTLLLRRSGRDPLLCGAFASVFAYSVVIALNVTQPILISTYFSICALALSRVGYLDERKEEAFA